MPISSLWDLFATEDPYGDEVFGDPLSHLPSYGSQPGGIPFLSGVLTNAYITVEAAFGADVTSTEPQSWNWTDITTDVRQADGQMISITQGRADESSQAQPARCDFQLDNTAGSYTANSPSSKYWPNVKRNTPIRVRLYINGSWYTRFQGYANGWVPTWDISANLAVVSVSASGVLRRLGQGKTPLRSPLYRAITKGNPIAYWPIEEGISATQANSGIIGGAPLLVITNTPPKFGTIAMTGSDSVADFSNGGQLATTLNPTQTSSWRVEFCAVFPAKSTSVITIGDPMKVLRWFTQGQASEIYVAAVHHDANSDALEVGMLHNDGTLVTELISVFPIFDGKTHQIRVQASVDGSNNLSIALYIDGVLQLDNTGNPVTSNSINITGVQIAPLGDYTGDMPAIGHLVIWAPVSSAIDSTSASQGFAGETTITRIARLCSEQSVPLAITGTSTTTMGIQTIDTFVNLDRECETTEDGLLFDGFSAGLSFTTRSSRYNATAILTPDMSLDPPQVGDPFTPIDDDQRNRNLAKVDRKNGSSAIYQDSTGVLSTNNIGTYDTSVTINTQDDTVLLNRAGWEVNKGTAVGFRYPTLVLDLAATPTIVPYWLASQLSSRIDVLNAISKATQNPPGTVSLLLEGYSETLGPFDWKVTGNCSSFTPWRVAVIEGSGTTAWRVEAGSSTLHASYATGVTSIVVDISDGVLWTTQVADFPFDIDVGGVQVTVTNITGSSSPQTFTVQATSYPLFVGSKVKLWSPATIAL